MLDPQQGLDRCADIGIAGGLIAAVGDLSGERARTSIDGTDLYASAGWVDLHAHVFAGSDLGIDSDSEAGVMRGVTTVVDAGCAGAAEWGEFQERIIEPATTRVLAFLNISLMDGPPGTPRHGDPTNYNQRTTVETIERHRDRIVGLKVMASQSHCGVMGLEPVRLAVEAAELAGTRVMCHIGNAPPSIQDVLPLLRPGDIVTHCWHGKPGGLLGNDGKPIPQAREAVERGVLFDIGHGTASFSFETARRALDAGLPVHSISTDLHKRSLKAPVRDLSTTMAKFLHLGFSLQDVIRLCTWGPAQCVGMDDKFGSLLPGRTADVTLFAVDRGSYALIDSEKHTEVAGRMIRPVWCIRGGKVCLRP